MAVSTTHSNSSAISENLVVQPSASNALPPIIAEESPKTDSSVGGHAAGHEVVTISHLKKIQSGVVYKRRSMRRRICFVAAILFAFIIIFGISKVIFIVSLVKQSIKILKAALKTLRRASKLSSCLCQCHIKKREYKKMLSEQLIKRLK